MNLCKFKVFYGNRFKGTLEFEVPQEGYNTQDLINEWKRLGNEIPSGVLVSFERQLKKKRLLSLIFS